jgi:hypothetical protein
MRKDSAEIHGLHGTIILPFIKSKLELGRICNIHQIPEDGRGLVGFVCIE